VDNNELSFYVTQQAERMGVAPELLARRLTESSQLGAAAGEVLRAKAVSLIAERVKVTDESGQPVDVNAVVSESAEADAEAANADADVTEGAEVPDDADAAEATSVAAENVAAENVTAEADAAAE
jgi:trigger factor